MPSNDPISMPAGRACAISWTYSAPLPAGVGLVFTAQDPRTGATLFSKANLAAGGSEAQFTSPPGSTIGGAGAAAGAVGLINLHGADTKSLVGVYAYDVKIYQPSDATTKADPDFPSIGTFTLTDHASR